MKKIIRVSNFDDETVNDILVAENINGYYEVGILNYLIDTYASSESSKHYFNIVEGDYILREFKP